jgi:hypothetical protein
MLMKSVISVMLVFLLLSSCKTQEISQKKVSGIFHKTFNGPLGSLYTLEFQEIGKFTLNVKGFEFNSQCTGKWKIEDEKFIILTCDEPKPLEGLQAGYMSTRLYRLPIISSNKIQYGEFILKRVK